MVGLLSGADAQSGRDPLDEHPRYQLGQFRPT